MNDVRDYMETQPPICTPLTSIENIKKLMAEKGVEELMVVDTILEKHLVGTISDKDINEMAQRMEVDPMELNAEQCIRPIEVSIPETATLAECQRLLDLRHINKISVTDTEGHLCGVLDQKNLVQELTQVLDQVNQLKQ